MLVTVIDKGSAYMQGVTVFGAVLPVRLCLPVARC